MGLSSIATLSLGLSMSMAGAGRAVIRSLGPGHRQALEQFFPVVPPPTAALTRLVEASESAESMAIRHQCSQAVRHPEYDVNLYQVVHLHRKEYSVLSWVGHLTRMSHILQAVRHPKFYPERSPRSRKGGTSRSRRRRIQGTPGRRLTAKDRVKTGKKTGGLGRAEHHRSSLRMNFQLTVSRLCIIGPHSS